MKHRTSSINQSHEKEFETLQQLFSTYFKNQKDSITDVFYTFLTDKMFEIQEFLYKTGYKEIFLNSSGIFLKKSDIFRSVCIDKIYNNILKRYEGKIYTEIEHAVFLGKANYYKPDIALYNGYNEEVYNNYCDTYLTNPEPTLLIEFVDFSDEAYVKNVISVYKNTGNTDLRTIVLFVDLVRKELYRFQNCIGIDTTNMASLNSNDFSFISINNYLMKMEFQNDLHFSDFILNFDSMLSSKKWKDQTAKLGVVDLGILLMQYDAPLLIMNKFLLYKR